MKTDIFSFSRFGKYFISELTSIFAGKGISILAFGLMPVYILIMNLLFSMFGNGFSYIGTGPRSAIMYCISVVFVVWMPSTCYGFITDKRAGSVYTLIPVSGLEKALSMILNTLISATVPYFILYFGLDLVITLAATGSTETSLVTNLFTPLMQISDSSTLIFSDTFPGTVSMLLLFLLGGIFFRRHKIAKTILVWMGIAFVIMLVLALLFNSFITGNMEVDFDVNEKALKAVNAAWTAVIVLLLCTGIFFRIKKIQY